MCESLLLLLSWRMLSAESSFSLYTVSSWCDLCREVMPFSQLTTLVFRCLSYFMPVHLLLLCTLTGLQKQHLCHSVWRHLVVIAGGPWAVKAAFSGRELTNAKLQILQLLTKQTRHLQLSWVKIIPPDTTDSWSCTKANFGSNQHV